VGAIGTLECISISLVPDEAVALALCPLERKARPPRDWLYNRIFTVGNIGPLYIRSDECPLSTPRRTGATVSRPFDCATSPLHKTVPHSCRSWQTQRSLIAAFRLLLGRPHIRQDTWHARNSNCVRSILPLDSPGMVGQALRFVAAAGCSTAAHSTPEPDDNHSCEHRQYSHMVQGCVRSGVRVGCRMNTNSLATVDHRDSIQLGMTSLPICTILSLAQTLHRDRRRGTRLASSASIRNSGNPPFNVVPSRLVWPLLSTFEPHSIARASLEPSASPVRSLISQQGKFFDCLTGCQSRYLSGAAVYLPLLWHLYRSSSMAYRTVA
jgi:hypothetical protein